MLETNCTVHPATPVSHKTEFNVIRLHWGLDPHWVEGFKCLKISLVFDVCKRKQEVNKNTENYYFLFRLWRHHNFFKCNTANVSWLTWCQSISKWPVQVLKLFNQCVIFYKIRLFLIIISKIWFKNIGQHWLTSASALTHLAHNNKY